MPSHSTLPDWSPTVQVNIKNLIDDVQCYQTVRELRWPEGVACPSCESQHVIKRGFDDAEPARQRYECHDCDTRFDDLTDTIFAGHHQPLKVWVLCLYFMGLKLAPCGRTVLVDLVPDSPPMRTGHDGQRICDERLGLTSAVLPAWAVSWALTTPHHLCLLAGYVVAGHNVPA